MGGVQLISEQWRVEQSLSFDNLSNCDATTQAEFEDCLYEPWYGLGPVASSVAFLTPFAVVLGALLIGWEGISSRSGTKFWRTAGHALPILVVMSAFGAWLSSEVYASMLDDVTSVDDLHLPRGIAWALASCAIGFAVGAASRSGQRMLNGAIGGAVGGFVGGFVFDYLELSDTNGIPNRIVGLTLTGACVGLAIGLVEHARREHWLEIVSGGMAGKQFILYRDVTTIGSSPACNITLIKDTGIGAQHATLQTSGGVAELRSFGPSLTVHVNGAPTAQQRLERRQPAPDGDHHPALPDQGRGDPDARGAAAPASHTIPVIAVALAILAFTAQPLDEAVDAVVVVRAGASVGAAVVVDDDRAITAAHVVGEADEVTVTVDGRPVRATVADREPGSTSAADLRRRRPAGARPGRAAPRRRRRRLRHRGTQRDRLDDPGDRVTGPRVRRRRSHPDRCRREPGQQRRGADHVGRDADRGDRGPRPAAEGIGYTVAAPTVRAFLDGDTITGSLPFPFPPGDSEEDGGGVGGDSGVDVLPPLLALVAGAAALAGTNHWRTRKRTRRRTDPDVILHSRSGGGHGQP